LSLKVCESQLAARLEGEVDVLQKDKEELQSALQAAREKVHSLEIIMTSFNQDTVTQDTYDNQVSFTWLRDVKYCVVVRSFNEPQYEISPKLMWRVDWQTA
jgi:hypothetical protein